MSELIKYKKIINKVYFNQCSFDNRLNVTWENTLINDYNRKEIYLTF